MFHLVLEYQFDLLLTVSENNVHTYEKYDIYGRVIKNNQGSNLFRRK